MMPGLSPCVNNSGLAEVHMPALFNPILTINCQYSSAHNIIILWVKPALSAQELLISGEYSGAHPGCASIAFCKE
jgi:hypothetical protein